MGQTALHIGALWGSVDAVKALIEVRGNISAQNQLRGSSPLHAAALGRGPPDRRAECVTLLIQAKADPNFPDFGGEVPLDCASDEVIRLALGAAPLVLHKAVQSKQREALAKAVQEVQQGAVDLTLETASPTGETALHLAVAVGWHEGVELLLQSRANPITQNSMQQSPVHAAVLQGDHRLLDMMLAARADVSVKDLDPEFDPRYNSKSFEEKPYDHRTALHYAAGLGNILAMRLLLETGGADPNSPDSKCQTPLHLCLPLWEADAELEVGSGIRVTGLQRRPDWNGRLGSIIGPSIAGDGGLVRWPVLLDGAASSGVLLKDENVEQVPAEALDLLLAARADVNLGNQTMGETRTVLHEAVRIGDARLVEKVLGAGVHLDQQDKKLGLSALHLAARSKCHEIVQILVAARADTCQTTAGGKTAVELAETNGAGAATLALLRGGAPTAPEEEPATCSGPTGGFEALTPEQRAMLFID